MQPLEEDTATHSSTLAWRTPWTEEPTAHWVTKTRTQLKQLSMHAPTCTSKHIHTNPKNRSLGCGSQEGKYFWWCSIILPQNGQPCEELSLPSLKMCQQGLEVPSPRVVSEKVLNPLWLVCSEINPTPGFHLHYCTNVGPTCN